MRGAIFGNVGTIICFKVGVEYAEILEKEFYPEFKEEDLISLEKYRVYLKMTINGKTSKPFSAQTLVPFLNFKFKGNSINKTGGAEIKVYRSTYAQKSSAC